MCERISVPRSITRPIRSSPSLKRMPSTAVATAGKVLATSWDFIPAS